MSTPMACVLALCGAVAFVIAVVWRLPHAMGRTGRRAWARRHNVPPPERVRLRRKETAAFWKTAGQMPELDTPQGEGELL